MKTVIEMAQEATLLDSRDDWDSVPDDYREAIVRFAEIVRADEREACAKVCDAIHAEHEAKNVFSSYADAIRARGNT